MRVLQVRTYPSLWTGKLEMWDWSHRNAIKRLQEPRRPPGAMYHIRSPEDQPQGSQKRAVSHLERYLIRVCGDLGLFGHLVQVCGGREPTGHGFREGVTIPLQFIPRPFVTQRRYLHLFLHLLYGTRRRCGVTKDH